MTSTRQRIGRRAQQGVTMVGLLFWAGTVGFLAYLAVRTLPTVNEFTTIQSTIDKIAAAPPATVGDIRAAFDRQKEIEYSIQSISGKDLRDEGERQGRHLLRLRQGGAAVRAGQPAAEVQGALEIAHTCRT